MNGKERKERFALDVQVGSSGYFVRESSSGIVAGPRQTSDGVPRKITVPIDTETGEIRNIHMKAGYKAVNAQDLTPRSSQSR